ncbi:MAG: toxin-antitoxin system HicB family antitoxin [Micromonosporaceae bacterium]|nr:toxin-antitoxin system HicB family antitoxin [Micromonosporaceae bacterium]
MDLTPYLDQLRRDLAASAAAGEAEVLRAADLLAGAMDASARLTLMEALADAAAEITAKLSAASVEVRLRGREADLVVAEITHPEPEPAPTATAPTGVPEGSGDVARITLRLPEGLKEAVERAAAGEGISVNAWLVRAIAGAVSGRAIPPPPPPPFPPGRASFGKRTTGFAQA